MRPFLSRTFTATIFTTRLFDLNDQMKPGENLTDQNEQLQDSVCFSPKAINQDGGLRSAVTSPFTITLPSETNTTPSNLECSRGLTDTFFFVKSLMCSLTCHYFLIIPISTEHHGQVKQLQRWETIELNCDNHILQASKSRGQTKREKDDRALTNVSPENIL